MTRTHSFIMIFGMGLGFVLAIVFLFAPAPKAVEAFVNAEEDSRGMCFTNWNSGSCPSGFQAVQTGVWTAVWHQNAQGGGLVCISPRERTDTCKECRFLAASNSNELWDVKQEPCAICCK